MIVSIRTDIEWKNSKCENIQFSDGVITLSEDCIKVSASLSRDRVYSFVSSYPAYIDICADMAINIEYSNCRINDIPIELININQVHVESFRIVPSAKGRLLEWMLSSISYKYICDDAKEFHIVTAPFCHLASHFCDFKADSHTIELNIETYSCLISETDHSSFSKVTRLQGIPFDNSLYHLISFYTGCPINVVIDYSINDYGEQCVYWKPVNRSLDKEYLQNQELAYIQIGDSNQLSDFLKETNWKEKSEKDKGLLKQAIYTYVSSKYLPYPLQFLTIYSVLERLLGSEKGKEPYGVMQQRLPRYGINISKIGKVCDSDIRKLGLVLERETKDKSVTNFCDLRNYIMHFMMKPEIEEYLDRADLVSKMKFAVVIILLKKLGFSDCCFKKDWKHLSILA